LHMSNNKLAKKTSALMSAEEDVADKTATIAHLHEELLLEGNDAFVAMQRAQALDAELDNVYAKLYDARKRCRELDGKADELEAQNRALKKRDEQLESSVESGYGWADELLEKLRKEKKRGEMLEQVLEAEGIDVEVALSDMMEKKTDQA